MKFMLHCRKFCPEIRMSRVANSGAKTRMPSSWRPPLLESKSREGYVNEHTSKTI
jgi:hypothetical protein